MKRIVALIEDGAKVDLTSLVANAKEFKIEAVPNGATPIKRTYVAGQSIEKVLMQHFTPAGRFTSATASGWLSTIVYSASSVSGGLSSLVKKGLVLRNGKGHFTFNRPATEADRL